jgi:2-polyprenyl-3-methyl-5-hydroxy-6-metoxy-1,4-benzoquinol methylase
MDEQLDYSLYYKNWHDESPAHVAAMVDYHVRQLQAYLPPVREGAVLDLGCGMGFALLALGKLGFGNVRGIDIDQAQVAAARRLGANAELVEDAIDYLSHFCEKFQVITMLDVLEHIPVATQLPLLRAAYHALRPGGRLIAQVPNANAPFAMRWRYNDFTHFCSFTEYSLVFLLKNAAFQNVAAYECDPPARPGLNVFRAVMWAALPRWLLHRLWRALLAAEFGIAAARKIPTTLNIIGVGTK